MLLSELEMVGKVQRSACFLCLHCHKCTFLSSGSVTTSWPTLASGTRSSGFRDETLALQTTLSQKSLVWSSSQLSFNLFFYLSEPAVLIVAVLSVCHSPSPSGFPFSSPAPGYSFAFHSVSLYFLPSTLTPPANSQY